MKINNHLLTITVSIILSSAFANANTTQKLNTPIRHVLLLSVDGLHQSDLTWFVKHHPTSILTTLANNGIKYNHVQTPFPSDSFPGMVGLATGGNPATTGIYYDDAYSRALLPPSTSKTNCKKKSVALGTEVRYAENINKTNKNGQVLLDAGQGILGLYPVPDFTPGNLSRIPTAIMNLKSSPDDVRNILIDPAQLPVDPTTCSNVYPHQYLKVNTIFEVVHAKGLRTAWSDKHPAYEVLNGPSGQGVDDLFVPEINSVAKLSSNKNWTKNNVLTQKYDSFKVLSIINEINGLDHSGKSKPGIPAIFGMNFQAVSTAQKLNTSITPESSNLQQTGGYTNKGTVPGPVVQSALNFVNVSLKQIYDAIINNKNTASNTAIILLARQGQSPQNRSDLTIIDDSTMIESLNKAWTIQNPKAKLPLVAHAMDDDSILLWLNDRSKTATNFTKQFLLNYSTAKILKDGVTVPFGIGSDPIGDQVNKTFTQAGLKQVFAGQLASQFMHAKLEDQSVPDIVGIAQQGSVYGGNSLSKIAEHGGYAKQDRDVPIVVWGAGIKHGKIVNESVEITQVAPTILYLLGINPEELMAVKIEKTKILPGL